MVEIMPGGNVPRGPVPEPTRYDVPITVGVEVDRTTAPRRSPGADGANVYSTVQA